MNTFKNKSTNNNQSNTNNDNDLVQRLTLIEKQQTDLMNRVNNIKMPTEMPTSISSGNVVKATNADQEVGPKLAELNDKFTQIERDITDIKN